MSQNRTRKRNVIFPNTDNRSLRAWRIRNDLDPADIASRLNVSVPSYYRYETGYPPPPDMATDIVTLTHGAVRYRDLWSFFEPRYA